MRIKYSHLSNITRRVQATVPIRALACIEKGRDNWAHNTTFDTTCFSIILSGKGCLCVNGVTYEVNSPCVIAQWNGPAFTYGPDTTWNELFLIYCNDRADLIKECGIFTEQQPVWPIHNLRELMDDITILGDLINENDHDRNIDLIDVQCMKVIIQTTLPPKNLKGDPGVEMVEELRRMIIKNFRAPVDFAPILKKYKISEATVRRNWNKLVEQPPLVFQLSLKIREACYMLAETNLSISEIAYDLNFNDPFYFSRYFKKIVGIAPAKYREQINR